MTAVTFLPRTPAGRHALVGADLFTGAERLSDRALIVEDGRIVALAPVADLPAALPRLTLPGGLLAPGFLDLQVNGGGGVLFNDAPTVAGAAAIAAAHRRFGTVGLLPTLITDAADKTPRAIAAIREAIAAGVPGVLGLHLEGPFLNPDRRGVHAPEHIRRPTEADMALLTHSGLQHLLITLAPERVPPGTIRALAKAGARVAAGHTAADAATLAAAKAEGLAGYTHLFNAMPPLAGREPGPVGACLADPDSWCGLIADGHHVAPESLALAAAAKRGLGGRGRALLVTDAMPPVGAADPAFALYGTPIAVRDGRCTDADGRLAGAALDMATAVRVAVRQAGIAVDEALRMASLYPAEALGLAGTYGVLAPGARADLVWLDGASLTVRGTLLAGDWQAADATP